MKKFITWSILSVTVLLLAACSSPSGNPNESEKKDSVTFSERGIESEFQLPAGWSYEKTDAGVEQFSLYDQNHKEVGRISYFAPDFDIKNIETTFDDCWRAWDIGSSEINAGNQDFSNEASQLGLDHYIYIANDGRTSVAAESCKMYEGKIAYIYWVPRTMITNQQSLLEFYGKAPVTVIVIRDINIDEDDFIQLVHEIAKTVALST